MLKINVRLILWLCSILILTSCSNQNDNEPVEIGINPWPGYEFLYLAEQKGFFEKVGLNAKLVQLGSLSDAQRAYVNGFTDGLASTVIEAVQAEVLGGKPLKIVMVSDYSNGGDMIVARKEFKDMQSLKGKTIGCEVSSLGIFILQRALAKSDMDLSDVKVVNVEQASAEKSMQVNEIDAVVTYAPVAFNLLELDKYHKVFTSLEIPKEIIDTISISQEALDKNPGFVSDLHDVWQMALNYYESNPQESLDIMSAREGISSEDFKAALADLKLVDKKGQSPLFEDTAFLEKNVKQVCEVLVHIDSISTDCALFPDIVYASRGTE